MNRFGAFLGTAALAVAFGAGAVMAQAQSQAQTQPPATAPAAKAAPQKGQFKLKQPMTPIAKQCSAEADAKGLHGKERQKFRNTCKKAGAKKA